MFESYVHTRDDRFVDVRATCYPIGPFGLTFDCPALLALDLTRNDVQSYVRALGRLAVMEEEARETEGFRMTLRTRKRLRDLRADVLRARKDAQLDASYPDRLPIFDPLA